MSKDSLGDNKANHKWIGMIGAAGILVTFVGAFALIGIAL